MPDSRAYLIATLMGENNRGTPWSQQGILDAIANRQENPRPYGARTNSVQDVVTANRRDRYQFDTWNPRDTNNYDRATRALQGRDSMRGDEAKQYDQAAGVVDGFQRDGIGRGVAQGATFYQTASAPNRSQERAYWPNHGKMEIGDHLFTGPNFTGGASSRDPNAFGNLGFKGYLGAPADASIGGRTAPTSPAMGPDFATIGNVTPQPAPPKIDPYLFSQMNAANGLGQIGPMGLGFLE